MLKIYGHNVEAFDHSLHKHITSFVKYQQSHNYAPGVHGTCTLDFWGYSQNPIFYEEVLSHNVNRDKKLSYRRETARQLHIYMRS